MGNRFGFKQWYEQEGERLWRGWLRAREDGNEEPLTDWVLGEYDCYLRDKRKGEWGRWVQRLSRESEVAAGGRWVRVEEKGVGGTERGGEGGRVVDCGSS